MSNIKLDLSHFKHVSSDDKSTTLEHKAGHRITLAHKGLSKTYRDQLEALAAGAKNAKEPVKMAKGGGYLEDEDRYPDIKEADEHGPKNARDTFKPKECSDSGAYGLPTCHACGGEVKKMAEGGQALNDIEKMVDPQRKGLSEPPVDELLADELKGGALDTLNPAEKALGSAGIPAEPLTGAVDQKPQVDPSLQAKRDIYNQLANVRYSPSTGVNATFGPHGEAPQKFESDLWQEASNRYQVAEQQKKEAVAAEGAKAAMDNQARMDAGLSPVEGASGSVPPVQASVPTQQAPQPMPAQAPQGMPTDMGQASYDKAFGMAEQGAKVLGTAQANLGIEQAKVHQNAMAADNFAKDALAKAQEHYETDFKAALKDYQAGMIDPERYWKGDEKGNGGHSKIMSAIGMIVAGFNTAATPNAAVQFINQQIDRSIAAQAKNLQARDSILHANMDHYKNIRDAVDATRIMSLDAAAHELQQKASQAAGPLAQANVMTNLAAIQKDRAALAMQFGLRRAIMDLTTNQNHPPGTVGRTLSYIEQLNPEEGKRLRARYIPTLDALAQVEPTQEIRNKIEAHQKMDMAIKDLESFAKTHTTILPGTPAYVTGASKAEAVRQAIREANLGGVFKEGEKPLLDKFLTDNPAGPLKHVKALPQLRELSSANHRNFDVLKQSLGLPTSPHESGMEVQPVRRFDKANGKTALFDPQSKKFLGYEEK